MRKGENEKETETETRNNKRYTSIFIRSLIVGPAEASISTDIIYFDLYASARLKRIYGQTQFKLVKGRITYELRS